MKKIALILAAITTISFSACTGVKSTTSGMENTAYLAFISQGNNYKDDLKVTLDDQEPFTAETNKPYTNRPKGTIYKIEPGRHKISISYHGEVIYRKEIFVSTQETKKINLK